MGADEAVPDHLNVDVIIVGDDPGPAQTVGRTAIQVTANLDC